MINNENKNEKLSSPPFQYSTIPVVQSTVYTLPCETTDSVYVEGVILPLAFYLR